MSATKKFLKSGTIEEMTDEEYWEFLRYYDGGVYGRYYNALADKENKVTGKAKDIMVKALKEIGIDVVEA